MIFEELKWRKNGASAIVEGEKLQLSLDTVVKFNISEGKEITEQEWDELIKYNDVILAKNYLFNLLSHYQKTEKEAKRKLKEKGFSSYGIEKAIKIAKEYKYIDDKKYVALYLSDNKGKKGPQVLKNELYFKGVDKQIIEEAVETLSEEEQLDSAMAIALKYNKRLDKTLKSKQKLYQHLVQKGFYLSTVSEVLAKFNFDYYD